MQREQRAHRLFPTRTPRTAAVLAALGVSVAASAVGLAGCENTLFSGTPIPLEEGDIAPEKVDLEEAQADNGNRFVKPEFADTFKIVEDTTGLETARMFFTGADSRSLIITDPTDAAQLRGATLAISQHVPMVVALPDTRADILKLAGDLNVKRIVTIGDVDLAAGRSEDYTVIRDPGTDAALGTMTAFEYSQHEVARPEDMVKAATDLNPNSRTELTAAWERLPTNTDPKARMDTAIPAQSRRDAQMAPVIIAAPRSPFVSVVNARAYGADVRLMHSPDPRETANSAAMVAGLADGPLIALGEEFGSEEELRKRIADIGTKEG